MQRLLTVLAIAATVTATSSSAVSATTEDVTGDITAPEIVSLELQPAAVDVTDGPAVVVVTGRFTDADTGVVGASLGWKSPAQESHSYGTHFTLVSGSSADGVYRAEMPLPQGAAPGRWPIDVQVRDRVGNVRFKRGGELDLAGLPGHLDVASANPDLSAPEIVGLEVVPGEADVRTAASSVTVRARLLDDAAGVDAAFVFPTGPHGLNGGAHVPHMRLVSGTAQDGWWEGEMQIDRYAHAGLWTFLVRPMDALYNIQEFSAEDLAARGLSAQFTVLSEEDVQRPFFRTASLSAVALDVSDSDQEVHFDATVTDDLSGVADWSWGLSNVQLSLQHPIGQVAGQAGMLRTSGTALDGAYATTFTVPRHSATGLWTVNLSATDAIGNAHGVGPVRLAELGMPVAVLVYNTPLPPLDVNVDPGDAAALVQWSPPSDERGAEVTEYVVRELPQGRTVRADADASAMVVPDLDNGVEHTFVVHAVNAAGESDASAAVAAVPADGLTLPPPESPQPDPVTVTRLAGEDRIATAVAISQAGFPQQAAGAVVLSRSDDYADALAGTPLAARLDGPLLTTPSARLDPRALAEIRRVLRPGGTVHLLGGDRALSPAVAASVTDAGYRVQRLAGADRYATSVTVAEQVAAAPTAILLATGRSFADALSAGAAAAGSGAVVVLTDGRRLPPATAEFLAAQSAPRFAIGGPAAAADPGATPVLGANRYETSVLTAERFPGRGDAVALATGERFPDALAGGAHAARLGAPLLLTPGADLADPVARHLSGSAATTAYLYGGPTAIAEHVGVRVAELLAG